MSKVPFSNSTTDVQESFREVWTVLDTLTGVTIDLHGRVSSNAGDARLPSDLATLRQVLEETSKSVKAALKEIPANGYNQIEDEGTKLAKRRILNFIGAGIVAADGASRTDVTVQTASATLEGTVSTGTQTFAGAKTFQSQITSTLAIGTAPFAVTSTTRVTNLNVGQLEDKTWEAPGTIGSTTPNSGAFTTISASGVITSTVATGTAPFTISSTTQVVNLNCSQLLGATWASPLPIGSVAPAAATFTSVVHTAAVAAGAAGTVSFGNGTAATATNGTGEAMKANVEGYLVIDVAGTTMKIPYVKN